jgi:MFS family permease
MSKKINVIPWYNNVVKIRMKGNSYMHNRNFVTYLLFGITIFFAMVLTIMSPLLTEISKTFSLTLAQTGVIFSANFLGFTLFIFIGGILADHWGKKLVLSISLAGYALALFLFPLASNFYFAFIAIILLGGFGGIIEGTISALITDVNTNKPGFYLNLAKFFSDWALSLDPSQLES